MDSPAGVLDALEGSDLFRELPGDLLDGVAAASRLRSVRRGELIWTHGEPCAWVAVVAAGRLKSWSPGHDARQWVSRVVRPGETCGLAPCLDGGVATCNLEPLERSRVVLVPAGEVRAVFERSPAFARRVALLLARDLRRVLAACEDVTLRTPVERLARFLLAQAAGRETVELRETQTQIAAQLGTVREVVGRGFHMLEKSGVIARNGRAVRILSARELDALADGARPSAA